MKTTIPATVFIKTKGGRPVIVAQSEEVAKKLAEDGELVLTPHGAQVLADIDAVFPGSKVLSIKNLAKVKYSN